MQAKRQSLDQNCQASNPDSNFCQKEVKFEAQRDTRFDDGEPPN